MRSELYSTYGIFVSVFVLLSNTAVDALRCYSCNSQRNQNCENLSAQCQTNIDCRADFINICGSSENACAVVYGPGSQVWRGCQTDYQVSVISNDQVCRETKEGRTCVCKVDMCNKSSRTASGVHVWQLVPLIFTSYLFVTKL